MTDTGDVVTPQLLDTCHHCGELVPVGTFCGSCGAHFTEVNGRHRTFAYAAAPHESVHRPAVVSTLFPHLPHRHAHAFTQALAIALVAVIALAALRLAAPATIAAAVFLPVLYLLYLHEVDVYEGQPLPVLGATFVVGGILGFGFVKLTAAVSNPGFSVTTTMVVTAALLAVLAQAMMLAGPLLLLPQRRFDEALDGLSFGVASALGFTAVVVIAGYWNVLSAPLVGASGVTGDDIMRILRAAVLGSLVNATSSGLIASSIWVRRHGRARGRHQSALRGTVFTVIAVTLTQALLAALTVLAPSLLLVVVLWLVAAALLLVWLRIVLHHALLDEGAEHHVGPPSACAECHRLVPTMLFCPACGAARSAAPKHSRADAVRLQTTMEAQA